MGAVGVAVVLAGSEMTQADLLSVLADVLELGEFLPDQLVPFLHAGQASTALLVNAAAHLWARSQSWSRSGLRKVEGSGSQSGSGSFSWMEAWVTSESGSGSAGLALAESWSGSWSGSETANLLGSKTWQ